MNCCLCGGKIFDDKRCNNPWPFCAKDDFSSKCCPSCDGLVSNARLLLGISAAKWSDKKEDIIPYKSEVVIVWSKHSEKPFEFFAQNGKFLAGYVQEVHKRKGIMTGTWGDFPVDLNEDNWFIVQGD